MRLIALFFYLLPNTCFGFNPLLTTDLPVLINGQIADRKDYPATIWIGNCTAAVVGPRTVLTAAHCVRNSISFTLGNGKYSADCVVSDHYNRNATADYALCYSDRDIVDTPYYENLATDESDVVRGDWILQTGFGCTKWGTRLDGQLRVGKAQVLSTPSGSSNDFETGNGAVLCSGDSGGPAWSLLPNGDRSKIISTNSRSNTTTRSYLSAWVTPHGKAAVEKYLDKFSAQVCGIDPKAPRCRHATPLSPVEFSMDGLVAYLHVTIMPSASYSRDDAQSALDAALRGAE